MGLFDMFKSKKGAEAARRPEAASQGPTTAARWGQAAGDVPAPPAGDPGDAPITELSLAADPANRPAWDALWKAVFGLPAWHVVTHTAPGGEAQPVRTTMNGQSCVLLYTSGARAAAARAHFAGAIAGSEVAVLWLPVVEAAEYVCRLPRGGPEAVLFNQGTDGRGFTESIPSVATMLEFFTGTLPAGCFARFIQAGNKMQHPEVWRRLKTHLARLPHWYMLTDPDRRDLPQLIETDGQRRTTVYSGEREAMIGAAATGLGTAGNVPALLELPPKEGAALLMKAKQLSGGRVSEVVLNFGSEGVALGIEGVVEAVGAQ